MQGLTIGALVNLLAAAEAVGDDEPVGRSFADRREKFEFPDGGGNVVLITLKPERSCHPAATGSRCLEGQTHASQHRLLGVHLQNRLVVAMTVNDGLAAKLRQGDQLAVAVKEFAEEDGLAREALGAFVLRKQVAEFVTEDRDAARFEAN